MGPRVWASHVGHRGCVASCAHAARVLGGRAETFDARAVAAGAAVPAAVADAPLLLLSGWHAGHRRVLDAARGRVAVRWHSPLLQTELSGDLGALHEVLGLLEQGRLVALCATAPDLPSAVADPRVMHLPDVLDPALVPAASAVARAPDRVDVALLGEPRARKSLAVQSTAVAIAAREDPRGRSWTLHLAGQVAAIDGLSALLDRCPGLRWRDHGDLPATAQRRLIASCDAGLCASLSESYGYLPAELLLQGVLPVLSPAVRSCALPAVTVADPGDPQAVAQRLLVAADPGRRAALLADGRASVHAIAARNLALARSSLGAIAELAGPWSPRAP